MEGSTWGITSIMFPSATGSLMELETHFLIANRLGYLPKEELDKALELTSEVGRMLGGLRKGLRKLNS
ncbi:MAG: four helix bundle protein [Terriglobia bacterium]